MALNQPGRLETTMDEEDTQNGRYLTFVLDEEVYGIEIRYVREIIGMQHITKLPETQGYNKGIINLRGKIIPVTDAREKFNKGKAEYNDRTCIVVTEAQGRLYGLIVDNVAEVISIDDQHIEPPPNRGLKSRSQCIKAIGKIEETMILLVDCKILFLDEETVLDEAIINF